MHLIVIRQVEMIDNRVLVLSEVVCFILEYVAPAYFHIVVSVRSALVTNVGLINSFNFN